MPGRSTHLDSAGLSSVLRCSAVIISFKVRFVRLGRVSLVPMTELEDRVPTLCRYLHTVSEGQRVAKR